MLKLIMEKPTLEEVEKIQNQLEELKKILQAIEQIEKGTANNE